MGLLPYPATVDEELSEVARRLRAGGLASEADLIDFVLVEIDRLSRTIKDLRSHIWDLEAENRELWARVSPPD